VGAWDAEAGGRGIVSVVVERENRKMNRSDRRWVVLATALILLALSWAVPASARADAGQDGRTGDGATRVAPIVTPLEVHVVVRVDPSTGQLGITVRIDPPCVGFDATANCPPPIVVGVDITLPSPEPR